MRAGDFPSDMAPPPQLAPTAIVGPEPARQPFYLVRNHALNKPLFRYMVCGPSPTTRDELIPMCRLIDQPPARARFSWEDRSAQLAMSGDAQTIATDRGFRAARANAPIRAGSWYFEVLLERSGGDSGGHVRLGVGRREAPLNAPVGVDAYSYGVRDKTGERVTLSQPRPYGRPAATGDVIGVLLRLPPLAHRRQPDPDDLKDPAHIVRNRAVFAYKGQLFFESAEFQPAKEMTDLLDTAIASSYLAGSLAANAKTKVKAVAPGAKRKAGPVELPARPLPRLEGSSLSFFLNGEPMSDEPAFTDLYDWLPLRPHGSVKVGPRESVQDDGMLGYFPFVSVYGTGVARLLADASELRYPVPMGARPYGERYFEYMREQRKLDDDDEAANRKILGPKPRARKTAAPSAMARNASAQSAPAPVPVYDISSAASADAMQVD